MTEFDERDFSEEASRVPGIDYRNAYSALLRLAGQENVTAGITSLGEALKRVVGVGHALDDVIRANGRKVLPNELDYEGENRFSFSIPISPERPNEGNLTAETNGVIVTMLVDPRQIPSQLIPESTFLTLPINDMDWMRTDTAVPSLRIGTGRNRILPREPHNGLLQQVYISTLRQNAETVVNAARPPYLYSQQGNKYNL